MSDAAAPHGGSRWALVPVGLAATLVAAMWLRFGGQWAENDTVVLTRAARGVLDQGTINPAGVAYDHGFAYPTLLATLAEVTGVSVRILQTTILPWLTVATALVACVAFRAVTGNARAGAVAASFLLLQPDFLFVNQRGSHEKMTWTLVLALLFALAASLRARRLGEVGPLVVVFYLCGFAVLCTNAFFGSSLTTVILFAAVGSAVVARRFLRFADRPASGASPVPALCRSAPSGASPVLRLSHARHPRPDRHRLPLHPRPNEPRERRADLRSYRVALPPRGHERGGDRFGDDRGDIELSSSKINRGPSPRPTPRSASAGGIPGSSSR